MDIIFQTHINFTFFSKFIAVLLNTTYAFSFSSLYNVTNKPVLIAL